MYWDAEWADKQKSLAEKTQAGEQSIGHQHQELLIDGPIIGL